MTQSISLNSKQKLLVLVKSWLVWHQSPLGSSRGIYIVAALVGIGLGLLGLISPWLSLALAVGMIVAPIILLKPIVLGYLLIAIITLTGGMERGRLIPRLTPNDVTLLLSVVIVLPAFLVNKQRQMGDIKVVTLAFILLVTSTVFIPMAIFLLQGVSLNIDNMFKLVAPLQYYLLFWLFTRVIPENETGQCRLIQWMLFCGSIVAIVGLLQAAGVGFVINILKNWYSSQHVEQSLASEAGRITSLMGAWNSLGMFLMVCILIAWTILPGTKGILNRANVIGALVVCGIALITSGSFAGTFGMIAGIPLIMILSKRIGRMVPILIIAVIGAVITFFLLQSFLQPIIERRLDAQLASEDGSIIPETFSYRYYVWRDIFWPPIRQHFPWAVHPTVPAYYAWLYEESQYIMLLFRTGLVGLIGHLAWVGIMIIWLFRKYHQSQGLLKQMAIATFTIVTYLSIAGLTNAVFNYSGSIDYMWILFAFVASMSTEVS